MPRSKLWAELYDMVHDNSFKDCEEFEIDEAIDKLEAFIHNKCEEQRALCYKKVLHAHSDGDKIDSILTTISRTILATEEVDNG